MNQVPTLIDIDNVDSGLCAGKFSFCGSSIYIRKVVSYGRAISRCSRGQNSLYMANPGRHRVKGIGIRIDWAAGLIKD